MVDRVVDAVDRLPLAIEMAAARVGVMGLAELATLVTARLELLRSPLRGTTDRHRTLAAVIAWSEELLDEPDRAAFAELSVFAGPVLAADLDGVLSGGDAVDRVCVSSTNRSSSPRCRTAPPATGCSKPYGIMPRSGVDDIDALSLRHATWFTEITEAADALLRTPAELEGHERVEARRR